MAKKKKVQEEIIYAEVRKQAICETLETNYMPYAMSVIISRAIPEIDGLKPAHRKLLYTMYRMGLLNGKMIKSANIVGQTMQLNPHGDAAIYETMVRLTRGNEALLHPLVESQGNFGKQYSRDMAYAASRYTEAKLEPICNELFADINKNTVKFIDNYDGTMKEPTLLPTTFPHILVNPNQGIAVGMASNICSFNLREVCEATIAYMKDEKCDLSEIMPAPDFSMGAQLIYSKEEMDKIYETGRGSFKLRAKYEYDQKNNCLEIVEIPYTTTSEAIIAKIMECIKGGKLREISDARDETGLDGFKLAIDLKRGTDPDALMSKLYKLTPLEDSFSCNFNVLIDSKPMVLGVKGIMKHWLSFRIQCIKNATQYDISKKSAKLHLLTGLKKILLDIDKAITIVRHTQRDEDVVPNLMDGFGIDQLQAEYVAEIKLRNLNKEYILNRTSEIEKLIEELEELEDLLTNDRKIKKIISKQLSEIAKKYGIDRKTELVSETEAVQYTVEETVEEAIELFDDGYTISNMYCLVGLLMIATNKPLDETTAFCEKAYDYDCDNRDIVDNLLVCYIKNKNYEKATELSKILTEQYPLFIEGWYHTALMYYNMGDNTEAKYALSKIKDCDRTYMTTISEEAVAELENKLI